MPVTFARPERCVDLLRITMVGHATLPMQTEGLNTLTDLVWLDRTGPCAFLGPNKVTVPGVLLENLPPIRIVLFSHNHYDHFNAVTLRQLYKLHAPLKAMPLVVMTRSFV